MAVVMMFVLSFAARAQPIDPPDRDDNCGRRFARPVLARTSVRDETFAGYTYHVQGELVPALTIELKANQSVYFEHHIMFWKDPAVRIGIKSLKGALKRIMAGMQIFVTEATGYGRISFSRDGPGHIVALHISEGEEIDVREHQFLAATDNIDYRYKRLKGFANWMYGGNGMFIDIFHGHRGEGILWLHGYGNVFEVYLKPGEQIEVEPGGWLYKDTAVTMETNVQNMSTGWLGSTNFVTNRFTGPGRLALQSMYMHYGTSE